MPKKVNKRGANPNGDEDFPSRKERGTPAERRRRPSEQNADSGVPVRSVEKATLYIRVSAEKSAESDLPISDQQVKLEKAFGKGWRASTLFDKYQSRRSAIESMRARRRMVMEGYWPGGRPPYGYKLVTANNNPRRKVLVLNADESSLVEKIFSFVRCGDGGLAPMSISAIAAWLNNAGFRTRDQSRWGIQAIRHILTNSIYCGMYYWGVSAKDIDYLRLRGPISLHVPPIVPREEFDAVQQVIGTA